MYTFVDGHLGCFQVLATVNSVHECYDACIFLNYSFLQIAWPRNEIAGSYGSPI